MPIANHTLKFSPVWTVFGPLTETDAVPQTAELSQCPGRLTFEISC